MARKEKQRMTGMRRGMRILGTFHYGAGFFLLASLAAVLFTTRFALIGETFREKCPPALSFIRSWDNTAVAVALVAYMLAVCITEFMIGRNWHRKALNTKGQVLTLVLSGIKIIRALLMLLLGGFMIPKSADVFTLVLNGASFSLAFLMHREYIRTNRQDAA